ncbi:MAG: DUF962 domain-containing protein [Acidobacteria bacterium]|nr:DUF962 domain-containing protein [Acidobacteriota bacterium]MCB9398806.1 DUF962 domain-containing protein [Acidobacteriota bacterium]
MDRYSSFERFYPFYLSQHQNRTCRRLHVLGSLAVLALVVAGIALQNVWLFCLLPVCGYGFAWVGHFFFEKNKPATFTYPLYSFIGDWVMLKDVLSGKIEW